MRETRIDRTERKAGKPSTAIPKIEPHVHWKRVFGLFGEMSDSQKFVWNEFEKYMLSKNGTSLNKRAARDLILDIRDNILKTSNDNE